MDKTMLNGEALQNLLNAGWCMAIFLCAYGSNMAFSIFYNTKILNEKFSFVKIFDSVTKIISVAVGTILLLVGVTMLPIFANYINWEIPEEFRNAISSILSFSACLYISCRYFIEAFEKLQKILKSSDDMENIKSRVSSNSNDKATEVKG